jgi:hypothetical protein
MLKNMKRSTLLTAGAIIAGAALPLALLNSPSPSRAQAVVAKTGHTPAQQVRHQTVSIDGVNVFYREAGRKDAPALLLLHGFPTSSHIYRNLIPALADKYRVIAPD